MTTTTTTRPRVRTRVTGGWQRLDAREVVVVRQGEKGVAVDWDDTRRLLRVARASSWRQDRAQARVNVRAIAQGASERNISVAIAASDAMRALRAVHSAFWLSPQCVSVGVIGPGQVGRALLSQLAAALPRLHAHSRLDLRLRGIADSRRMRLG